jgi:uncharacterized membrane protein (UPF0127 family)
LLIAPSLASCACGERAFSIEASPAALSACAGVASTAQDRARGLIGRAPLSDREALWLEWPTSVEACIANAGVSFAIDAVFVDEAGLVLAVERAIPADDPAVRCHAMTRHVIELRADAARAVSAGSRVRW